jgi:uncharacterized protein (DUF924 family)
MKAAAGGSGDVIQFWFSPSEITDTASVRRRWFVKDPAFDREIINRFLPLHDQAAAGALDDWLTEAESALALVLVLDQFPRNMFRDTPRAFATDSVARAAASHALAQGFDRSMEPDRRQFFYVPFEHSEALADQEISLRLTAEMPGADQPKSLYQWALAHHAIIARFGRFPHRNAILGRTSTTEELAFLARPGSHF